MLNSRCLPTIKTLYNCLQAVSRTNTLNEISKTDHTAFDLEIANLALDHTKGTPQHKRSIIGHMFNYKFNIANFYSLSKYRNLIITNETIGPSSNVIAEFPVAEAFLDRFWNEIKEVLVTSDTTPIVSAGQKQTNPDFRVEIYTNTTPEFSNNQGTIYKIHDAKNGSGILRHSTRGSLGIITFDQSGNNIQTTPIAITEAGLVDFNYERLLGLIAYLKSTKQFYLFENSIHKCYVELNLVDSAKKSIFDATVNIENILWKDIQRHSEFERSISFVFLKKLTLNDPLELSDEKYTNFKNAFMKMTSPNRNHNKPYDLDKKGDSREVYKAALMAYKNHVDKDIYDKLKYLNTHDINLNNYFFDILSTLNKL